MLFFEEAGAVVEIGSNFKAFHHNKMYLAQICETLCMCNQHEINIIKKKVLAMIKIEDLIKIIITIKNNLNLTKEVFF